MPNPRHSFLLVLLVLLWASCAGKNIRPDTAGQAPVAEIAPGADGWTGGALLLPQDAPAVVEMRPDQLFDGLRRFKDWVFAEPAMLGEDGEETVRNLQFGWSRVEAWFGVDPLHPSTWHERGIDVSRPMFVAPYPLSETDERFIATVESRIRSELGVPPRGDVRTSLHTLVATAGSLPEGANARVLRAVEGHRPIGGLRVVIPVTTSVDFLESVRAFAEGAGFQQFPPELSAGLALSPLEAAFWSSGAVPAFAVRTQGSHAVLDLLWPGLVGATPVSTSDPAADLERVYEDLRKALDSVPFGRPRAPRAADQPSVAMSFDQVSSGALVKLRGYHEALQSLRLADAASRDALLLEGMLLAGNDSANWLIGAREVPGLAYALHIGAARAPDIGRATMTMYGGPGVPPLPAVPRYPSLGIQDRSAAIGVTFEPSHSQPWETWFAGRTYRELNAASIEGLDWTRVAIPGVRMIALALANVGSEGFGAELFPHGEQYVARLKNLRRLEIVGLTPDVTALRLNPKFLVAAILEPTGDVTGQATDVRDAIVGAMRGLLGLPDAELKLSPVVAGAPQPLTVEGLPVTHSQLVTDGEVPYLLVGLGLEADELESEAMAMGAQQSAAELVSLRLEPISFLSWLRLDDAKMFEPLDLNILAQRLGPLLLQFAPGKIGAASTVSLDVVLRDPPKL